MERRANQVRNSAFKFLSGSNVGLVRYISEACRRFVGGGVAKDDILDALVAAVTARCGHDRLQTIPNCPPKDCKGLPMEMVYYKR